MLKATKFCSVVPRQLQNGAKVTMYFGNDLFQCCQSLKRYMEIALYKSKVTITSVGWKQRLYSNRGIESLLDKERTEFQLSDYLICCNLVSLSSCVSAAILACS